MKTYLIGRDELHWYSSMSEVLCMDGPKKGFNEAQTKMFNAYMNTSTGGKRWYGVDGGADGVRKVMKNGWPEGVNKVKELIDEVELPSLPSYRRTRSWGKNGYSLSLNRVLTGSNNPWRKMKKEMSETTKKKRHGNYTLFIDFNANGHISAEQQAWRAVVGIRMAEALMRSGRRVRIVAATRTAHSGGRCFMFAVVLKNYDEPLDINACIIPIGLSGFLRVYEFCANACVSSFKIFNMGRAVGFDPNIHFGHIMDDSFPMHIEKIWSREGALQTLEKFKDSL